jgi:hypothetical protein
MFYVKTFESNLKAMFKIGIELVQIRTKIKNVLWHQKRDIGFMELSMCPTIARNINIYIYLPQLLDTLRAP